MRVCGMVLGLAVALLLSVPARAQIAIYGQAAGADLQFAETPHLYGGAFGIYDTKPVGPISIGADFRGGMMKRGSSVGLYNDTALDTGEFGLRVAAAPGLVPFAHSLMPYAEALVGLGYWRGGGGVTREDGNHFLTQLAVGLDYTIVPHVEWRVAEFTYGRDGAMPGHINPETLSTGIVLRVR